MNPNIRESPARSEDVVRGKDIPIAMPVAGIRRVIAYQAGMAICVGWEQASPMTTTQWPAALSARKCLARESNWLKQTWSFGHAFHRQRDF